MDGVERRSNKLDVERPVRAAGAKAGLEGWDDGIDAKLGEAGQFNVQLRLAQREPEF